MFEQEIELEKHESSVVPLLMIVILIAAIVGVAGYFVWQNKQVLSDQDATRLVTASLNATGPAVVPFSTGDLVASVESKPKDPRYRLLEKAGLVKIGKDKGRATPVALTAAGEKELKEIPGVVKTRQKDGTEAYVVPLAERRLVGISKISMNSPSRATVQFSWKWQPNKLGEIFDATGPQVKSFNTWDRGTLISKYGANFYHADPTKVTLLVVKGEKGWQVSEE